MNFNISEPHHLTLSTFPCSGNVITTRLVIVLPLRGNGITTPW
nr:hypothetical protein [uncultured Prevotella sp.]